MSLFDLPNDKQLLSRQIEHLRGRLVTVANLTGFLSTPGGRHNPLRLYHPNHGGLIATLPTYGSVTDTGRKCRRGGVILEVVEVTM